MKTFPSIICVYTQSMKLWKNYKNTSISIFQTAIVIMMMSNSYIYNIDKYIEYLFFPFLCLMIGLSVLWDIYFVKRILYFVRLYRESMEESKTDIFGNSSEAALHYKVEIVKYFFLIMIGLMEICTFGMYESIFLVISLDHNQINNCTIGTIYSIDLLVIANPIAAVFLSLGNTATIFSGALVICLMRYLDVKYHDVNAKTFPFIRCMFVVTSLLGVALIVAGSVPQLFILQKMLYLVTFSVYFYLWVKQSRTFYKTLKWRSVEFKVRGRSSQMVRRSIKSCYHFAFIMTLMGIGFLSMLLNLFLHISFFIIATAVYYGPCLFHHLYGTPYYEPLLTSNQQIEYLHISSEIVAWFSAILVVITYIVIGSPYIFLTIAFFGGKLWKALKYRFGRVRTRFTPSLTDPLLIT